MSDDSPICTTCGEPAHVVDRTWWTYTARCRNPDCDNTGGQTIFHARVHAIVGIIASGVAAATGTSGAIVLGVAAGTFYLSLKHGDTIRREIVGVDDGADPVDDVREAYLKGDIDEEELEERLDDELNSEEVEEEELVLPN